MHGFCTMWGTESGLWQIALRIEDAATTKTGLYGLSIDHAKAFDSVPHAIAFHLVNLYGVPGAITRPLRYMCDKLQRRFKVGPAGYGPPWTATNGILQGCPTSVLLLNLLMTT